MNRIEQPPSSYYPDDRRNSFDNRNGPRSSRRPDTGGHPGPNDASGGFRANRNDHESQGSSDYQKQQQQPPPSRGYDIEPSYNNSNNKGEPEGATNGAIKKRSYDDYQKQQPPSRGYDIKPAYAKRRGSS
jgi:hypothetical protein